LKGQLGGRSLNKVLIRRRGTPVSGGGGSAFSKTNAKDGLLFLGILGGFGSAPGKGGNWSRELES